MFLNVFRRKPSLGAPEDRLLWTSTKCPFKRDVSHRKSNKGSKESQEPTLGVVFSEVSVERESSVYKFSSLPFSDSCLK